MRGPSPKACELMQKEQFKVQQTGRILTGPSQTQGKKSRTFWIPQAHDAVIELICGFSKCTACARHCHGVAPLPWPVSVSISTRSASSLVSVALVMVKIWRRHEAGTSPSLPCRHLNFQYVAARDAQSTISKPKVKHNSPANGKTDRPKITPHVELDTSDMA